MSSSSSPEADPLEGFRGDPVTPEEELRILAESVDGLLGEGVDKTLVRQLVLQNRLSSSLAQEDSIITLLAHQCEKIRMACMEAWMHLPDAMDERSSELQVKAKAAQMVLDFINEIELGGDAAAKTIQEIDGYEQ